MQKNKKNPHGLAKIAISSCLLAGLVACSSDDGDSNHIIGTPYVGTVTPTENYDIPELRSDGSGGYVLAPAVDGNFPAVPASKILVSGEISGLSEAELPRKVEHGDEISISWKMYGLRSGALVEDSDTLFGNGPVNIILGGGKGGDVTVPPMVHEALIGQRVGDTVQVVFEYDMPTLPEYLEADDAYTLAVKIVDKT